MNCEQYRAQYPIYSVLPLPREVWDTPAFDAWVAHLHDCTACQDWKLEREVIARGYSIEPYPCVHMAYYATFTCPQQ